MSDVRGRGWSREACRRALQDAAARLGRSPTMVEYDEIGYGPSGQAIRQCFGTWNAAKRAAGLECYGSEDRDGS